MLVGQPRPDPPVPPPSPDRSSRPPSRAPCRGGPGGHSLIRGEEDNGPVTADVHDDDAHLQLDTRTRVGDSQRRVTDELEHDSIGAGRAFNRPPEPVRERGGEPR